jgi:hypothetical protein
MELDAGRTDRAKLGTEHTDDNTLVFMFQLSCVTRYGFIMTFRMLI